MEREISQLSDSELFLMLLSDKKSAEKAFSEVYARYSPRVYAYCRRYLGDYDAARDVFQETFLHFFQNCRNEKPLENLQSFLLMIARNLCNNQLSRAKQTTEYQDYMSSVSDTKNEREELLDLVKTAIELLPPEYREIFVLREYDGMSYSEIADITGEPMSQVKIKIFRAKQKVREILSPYLADLSKF